MRLFQAWFAAYADQYVLIGGTAIDPKALQLRNVTVAELVARIAKPYEIELPPQMAT